MNNTRFIVYISRDNPEYSVKSDAIGNILGFFKTKENAMKCCKSYNNLPTKIKEVHWEET